MDFLWQFEIGVNLFLQSLGEWLILPMKLLSFLGKEEFFTIIMPFLYWCVDARLGLRVSVMLLLSNGFNNILKQTFRTPRPFWYDHRVLPLAVETSFGLPSGHAQISSSVWGLLAFKIKKRAVSIIVWTIVFLIGFSRVYLGVHFTSDVIIGWLSGITLMILFIRWEKGVIAWFAVQPFSKQLGLSVLCSFVLLSLMVLPVLFEPTWNIPADWIVNASRAIPPADFTPLDVSGAFTTAGTFLGMTTGVILLRRRYQIFDTSGSLKIKSLRYLVGIIGMLAFWYGLGQLFPRTDDFLGFGLRFLRYALVGLWIAYLAPVLFFKMGLLSRAIKPSER
ncbi:MAG: phosphatase PAP2 family protein [Anaerolineae bacterium]|nr:phosphatase PAP2 family protein [Anaerolineae bacterium]